MSFHDVNGVQIEIQGADTQGDPPNSRLSQLQQLLRSLQLMPAEHLRLLPPIIVGNRPPLVRRVDNQGRVREVPIGGSQLGVAIRLHYLIFQKSWNRGEYNETVLHEAGHIVDWSNGYTADLRRHHSDIFRRLTGREYHGATPGAGEYFGDAYKNYLLHQASSAERQAMEATAFRSLRPPAGPICGP